ncbi:MAG: hypothetical protein QM330_02385 [Acidobacteriota bacterium]|jgi:hypothetical protein|nr:hypothetical protein [Acidobacteriota bacterium]NLT32042.1 hypothetical protein [Acidobacteriota bacterium]
MAQSEIMSGACGMTTKVTATMEGKVCKLKIESSCKAIQEIAAELVEVDPYREISFRQGMPRILEMGHKHCFHTACPVPVGILKAMEVAAGLNVAKDPSIKICK